MVCPPCLFHFFFLRLKKRELIHDIEPKTALKRLLGSMRKEQRREIGGVLLSLLGGIGKWLSIFTNPNPFGGLSC
jgi:hypothetical protein